ncbi:TrbI/VirB10 family protein [Photobacterium damselae]|uniref:TrbI/VirB10 family protein n=1 Tax=Photobacterium damselae TaxID=38293 RepID=UPI004068E315
MSWKTLFTRRSPESLDDNSDDLIDDNTQTRQRNTTVLVAVIVACGLSFVAFKLITKPKRIQQAPPPEYEAVLSPDFTGKDTQSALQAQQQTINELQDTVDKLQRQRDALSSQLDRGIERLEKKLDTSLTEVQRNWDNQLDASLDGLEPAHTQKSDPANATVNPDPFGALDSLPQEPHYPKPPTHYEQRELKQYRTSPRKGIQTFSYRWPSKQAPYRRTSQNYVPTGSFVTAVLIGAADANAGVNAQGDTAPILFRAIHDGILPNGKRSHLRDCLFTASVYGEISSNRGIARLQNISCIFEKNGQEQIIDMPVQGTAFNFGRNGIRGTPVMRNGKIIQMAGISGVFTGLGETGKNASSSTISNPSGVLSTVNPSDALLNMGGSALESVGEKLSDYYIKLAEQYHPIIELNPGSVVNLVFLAGFPLDPAKIEEYEAKMMQSEEQMGSQLMNNFINPLASPHPQSVTSTQRKPQAINNNPLMQQLPANIQPSAERYNQTQQSQVPTSPWDDRPY